MVIKQRGSIVVIKDSKYAKRYRLSLEDLIQYAQRELKTLDSVGSDFYVGSNTLRAACTTVVNDSIRLETAIEIADA